MPTSLVRRQPNLLAVSAIAIGLTLSGCVRTKAALERRPPTIEARSVHTIAELSACLSDNLTRYSESTVNFVPRPDGATLTYNFIGAPYLTVTMIDHNTYRQVTIYGPYGLHTKVRRHRLDAVRGCL